jgi:hypothetical protein
VIEEMVGIWIISWRVQGDDLVFCGLRVQPGPPAGQLNRAA